MKRREERSYGFFGMGAALLLTVFLVLMMVTFSLLSLASARNDLNRCQMLANRRREFYEANNRAEEILHEIRQGETPNHPIEWENDRVRFEITTESGQILQAELQKQDGILQIIRWEIGSKG